MSSSIILRDKLLMVSIKWVISVYWIRVYQLTELFPTNEAHDSRRISIPNSNSV